ncbi:transmembrane protein 267 [Episyrphus balteatus]|uniref:transmembrane protein 267 n=1 Tax=Episyrphus balteatus TaxID=286459 RepID=UPI0024865793|nr:transmembrane protein 267 [Episyrphus balteatus]
MSQMFCHLMVYMRIVLSTLVIITCLLGDNFVELTQHPLLRALLDNATHAVIGALSGIAFVVQFYDRTSNLFGWLLIFICFSVSALIDVDHFVEARSWNLEDATNLLRRPFLHCTTIPMMLLVLFVCTASLNYFKTSLILGVLICAFVTHHTRDAVRRGYWMCPFGQTDPIPHLFYILTTILTPYLMYYLHCFCRSSIAQQILGNYVKLSDHHHHHHHHRQYRYSIV